VSRTFHDANLTWALPRADICALSGYSGSVLRVNDTGGARPSLLLKTWVVKTNCSTPPAGHGWGVLPHANIWLWASLDGLSWHFRSEVVSAAAVVSAAGSTEGANENDLARSHSI
jgi:hypothetical protein